MAAHTAEQLAQRAFDMGLLTDLQLQQVWGHFGSRNVTLDDFLQFMVRKEYFTNYQVERLMKGDRHGYFFGNYKVLYLVGTGTFARVYRAVHKDTGQVVAVKVLRSRFSDNPVQFGQFVREGQLGCALRHPNIVPIFEVYSQGHTHYLVMEFVEGQSLRDFVKIRKKVEPLEATRLAIDIASGLKYAFEHGLTHRDLKMSNVMVSSRGRAKLADFGLAAMDESVLEEGAEEIAPNARTIDYAALERATGVRKDDTRSDVYFLGCIYYNMLTGRPPLSETRDRMLRLSKQRFLDVVPIQKADPDLPMAVGIVVNKAMMLDVNKRYQTPAAMLTDLEVVARRLTEDAKSGGNSDAERQERDRLAAMLLKPELQRTLMIVESSTKMQDVFRDNLKKAGYRVLLTGDPERALGRLRQEANVADCAIFSAAELGESALNVFNRMNDDSRTKFIPALLILDPSQKSWRDKVLPDERRMVLTMPITMKQLLAAVTQVIPSATGSEQAT